MKRLIILAAMAATLAGCAPRHYEQIPFTFVPSKPVDTANAPKDARTDQELIRDHAQSIKTAIENKLYAPENYIGESCKLRLSFARDGLLTAINSEGGDPDLCQAAIAAAATAHFLTFPNDAVYNVFKQTTLNFQMEDNKKDLLGNLKMGPQSHKSGGINK